MNGAQSPDAQKALNANSNGSNSNNSSLAAKKRKKDLKPIITMEDTSQTDGNLYAGLLYELRRHQHILVLDLLMSREWRGRWRFQQNKHDPIQVFKKHPAKHGVASCITSQRRAVKQVQTSVDIAHGGIVPSALSLSLWRTVGLGLDRTTRPHKYWALTNLESVDRSLGPLYLISACPVCLDRVVCPSAMTAHSAFTLPVLQKVLGELDILDLSFQRPFIRRAGRSALRRVPAIPWSLARP
ncbi:hypothetical protein HG531_009462 [Fusarium graminearum]|nr:hypothetical protein HG531_009462 [Fusarium graminearum]